MAKLALKRRQLSPGRADRSIMEKGWGTGEAMPLTTPHRAGEWRRGEGGWKANGRAGEGKARLVRRWNALAL